MGKINGNSDLVCENIVGIHMLLNNILRVFENRFPFLESLLEINTILGFSFAGSKPNVNVSSLIVG